jgi:AcrR family transcriptional regulator
MERRKAAVEETRSRIVQATMELHAKKGVVATSWEEIAERAGVSPATVYRHFPTLNELVPACRNHIYSIIKPPTPEEVSKLLGGAGSLGERLRRMVAELFSFYERGERFIEVALRDRHLVQALDEALLQADTVRELFIREVLRPSDAHGPDVRMLMALTDFSVWRSLKRQGFAKDEAVKAMTHILRRSLKSP